jgi:hypothetical protein
MKKYKNKYLNYKYNFISKLLKIIKNNTYL